MHLSVCKKKLSLIYRKVVRELFRLYIGISNKQHIIASIERPSLANYLYGIIGVAWLCERMNITLEFVFPKENPAFFENPVLYQHAPNKTCPSKNFLLNSSNNYMASIARKAARKDLPAEYGHRIISQLSIKQDIQHQADEWFNAHIKGDWVAVHYRGTDAHTHPRSDQRKMSINIYIAWLKEVLDSQCSIFACSDQAQFVDQMKHTFPNRAYSREIERSTDNKPIHWSDNNQYSDRDLYQQKLNALIDMLILAKASVIYTTGSWFVDVVKNFNPKIKIVSLDQRVERRSASNYLPIPEESLLRALQKNHRLS